MKTICFAFAALAAYMAAASETLLADGWEFCQGGDTNKLWQAVSIPHDWAIAGPFDKDIDKQVVAIEQNGETTPTEKTGRSGSLPWIGEGWYRRTVEIPANAKFASILIDGAMSEPEVFWDGVKIGEWKYGYTPFEVEIPLAAQTSQASCSHILLIHCKNVPESSRWYPGAGLYRPVRLVTGGEVGIRERGVFVRTPSLQTWDADVDLRNPDDIPVAVTNYVREGNGPYRPWSPEEPNLYTLVTEVRDADGELLDSCETRFGFRTIEYGRDGFRLNGERRKFKGVCLHHDLGPIGAAFNDSAFRRQIRKLKWMGCDSIRTAHNIPSPRQLAICDEMGMMVMAESFDMWRYPKCKNGYCRFFDEWWPRDLTNLVWVCRSHPSVVMYSIGNEIPEQTNKEGKELSQKLQGLIHDLDATRPCTQGLDRWPWAAKSGVASLMDITGLNYRLKYYETARKAAKDGVVLGSETASTISSRGIYKFPVIAEPMTDTNRYDDGQCSSYDVRAASWSNLPDDDRALQEDAEWVIGEFVWTGFDYLGEPSPYDDYWPSRSSYFGIFDLAGIPKDRAWLYRSYWNEEGRTLHILPHWNWTLPDADAKQLAIPVYVYTDAPAAELFVNGKSQGVRTKDKASRLDRFRLRWNDVVYEPGELKAVALYKDGTKLEETLCTAGEPAGLSIRPDDGCDSPVSSCDETPMLRFFEVTVVDKDANPCPTAAIDVECSFAGDARFKAICNGDATSLESFVQPKMKTFSGKLVIVGEITGKGIASLSVSSPGIPTATVTIQ